MSVTIDMEWDDNGAVIVSTESLRCPVCKNYVTPSAEHRCGDRVLPDAKPGERP